MPTAPTTIAAVGTAHVECGTCGMRRVNPDHPAAVTCECGKTVARAEPAAGKEG